MTKKIEEESKKQEQQESPLKGKYPCTKDHTKEYEKKHEKASYPRRVWPTDSESHKKKGPKI